MRRTHDHLGATYRSPDRPAFSTPSPGEELMKRSRPFPKPSGPSGPTLSVCLPQPGTLFHCPSIVFYRRPLTLRSPLPPRFAARPAHRSRSPPRQLARETRFKSHSVVTRLPSNGCIESAPFRHSRGSIPLSPARFRYSTNVSGRQIAIPQIAIPTHVKGVLLRSV
jgi:hypothetical protein